MGLMKQAYDTYCALEKKYAGRYFAEYKEPLVPISHQITKAEIEITLDSEGELLSARLNDKDDTAIIIPVTEQSAGRVGDTSCAHPLCDQIRFLSPQYPKKYEAYLTQLQAWANSDYSHPKLHSIARYVEKGTILEDLQRLGLITLDEEGLPTKEKMVVCWRIESGAANDIVECWKDFSLFQAFIDYYKSHQNQETVYCMVSGVNAVPAIQHPKKIISANANAKLVSANDSSGFTYRGRFADDREAVTVSYIASQKAHSALRWLAANQGVLFGSRTFLCWNPQGISLPQPNSPFLRQSAKRFIKPSDYKQELQNTLKGWKEQLPADASAVIAVFDAATSGRLSLTYYNELQASDFLDRLHAWDDSCCWLHHPFGIQSPSVYQIANLAFGTPRTENNQTKIETDERILRQQIQRLVACRVDRVGMPADIEQALVKKASNLQIFKSEQHDAREALLFTACAVIRKYHFDKNKEEWEMALVPNKQDISYQYGRLLAVLEKIERDTYEKDEKREPNAIRMQSVFAQRPQYAGRIIWEQLKKAYYPRLKPSRRGFYDRLIGEIIDQISAFPESEQNRPLSDTYLLGYYLQRNKLCTFNTEEKETEE
ncbi:MAG: type I-C CRISPR-associated protein Cas8c/Csd1 [Eubacteriales bacterium]